MNGGQGARNLLALYRAWGTDESFSEGEKLIMGVFITCMNEQTFEAYPGEAWLARKVRMTAKPLRAHIKALVGRGELEVVKQHSRHCCTVYKVKWAERKLSEMEPKPAPKKVGKQYPPSLHHDNFREDSAPATVGGLYNETQEQSNYDNQWYEEEGARSLPPPTEEQKEEARNYIKNVLFATSKYLRLPSIFKNRAIDHWYSEKEAEQLYQEYQAYMKGR
jgi:hypothetical protein